MIPILERPVFDEMITAWAAHIAEINGLTIQELYKFFFNIPRETSKKPRIDYLVNLEEICQMEKESGVFPELQMILERHTDLYAELPLMTEGIQAKYVEYCLRNSGSKGNLTYNLSLVREYKVCPECAAEDLQKHHRLIMHVPHQSPAVGCCWKHGAKLVKMSDFEPGMAAEHMNEKEQEIAVFAHALYETPMLTTYELVKQDMQTKLEEQGLDFKHAVQAAKADGYLDAKQVKSLNSQFESYKLHRVSMLPRLLTWLYHTAENFRKSVPEADFVIAENTDFEVLGKNGLFVKLRCRTCGAVFHTHMASVGIGVPCPECVGTEDEVLDHYLAHYGNGEYVFTDESRTKIRHTVCGCEVALDKKYRFWKTVECLECQKKDVSDWQNTIDADATEYRVKSVARNKRNKPVLEIEHVGHGHSFHQEGDRIHAQGVFCPLCDNMFLKIKKERIGMRRKNKQGKWMTIVAYRSNLDMDVEVEGKIINMTYDNFLKGQGHKKIKIQNLIGTKKLNCQGWEMELVAYRTNVDIDVRFSYDGTIVNTDLERFERGTVFYPGYEEYPRRPINDKGRLGEEGYNTKGYRMTIIAYRRARDIDVQFDDGTIAEHVVYDAFKKGHVKKPKK